MKFQYFTRAQAIEWQRRHPKISGDPLTDMRLEQYEGCDLDQKVGVFAIDGDRVIGTNFFHYCPISVNGELIECIVSNNLFVAPEYRPKGIGSFLKMHVLRLGLPQISSGVSPQMQKVYDAWSAYTKVDASPVYAMPVSAFGILRVARIANERDASASGRFALALAIMKRYLSVRAFSKGALIDYESLATDQALKSVEGILKSERYPIQVPWNRRMIERALRGEDSRAHAWVIEVQSTSGTPVRHFVSGYLRAMQVRGLGRGEKEIEEFHLTEIFPPVRDKEVARACLALTIENARCLGVAIVQVYAMTEALDDACTEARLDSFFKKRVYIAPNTKEERYDRFLRTPSNWWCRIRNEDQLEENARGYCKMGQSNDLSPWPDMIY